MKKVLKRMFWILTAMATLAFTAAMCVNVYVVKQGDKHLVWSMNPGSAAIPDETADRLTELGADCIMVLGAGIEDRETPSPMLRERLDMAVDLYKQGFAPKLLLSGDNGTKEHNEIHVMLQYCISAGVPPEDIFCDHAGFSTYESMIRAKQIFTVKRMIVVTQRYHEYRALYLAGKEGMTALGASSDQTRHSGQLVRDAREILARNKDFFLSVFGFGSAMSGETIGITGDGSISHGE